MSKKRTYRLSEIATKLGKTRITVSEWWNEFRVFIPSIGTGRSRRYTEEAVRIFEMISKMKNANKSTMVIKEHLQEVLEADLLAIKDEKEPISTNDEPIAPIILDSNVQLSNKTGQLRSMIQNLKERIEANNPPSYGNAPFQETSQTVNISRVYEVAPFSRVLDNSKSELPKKVLGLQGNHQSISHKINEVFEEYIGTLTSSAVETLNRRYDDVSKEVTELRDIIQILDQDLKYEIFIAAEALNRRYDGVSEVVTNMHNIINTVIQKLNEASEQDIDSCKMINATAEILYGVVEDVNELRNDMQNRYKLVFEKVIDLHNVIQTLTQKVNDALQPDVRNEIFNIAEKQNLQYEDINQKMIEQQRRIDALIKLLWLNPEEIVL